MIFSHYFLAGRTIGVQYIVDARICNGNRSINATLANKKSVACVCICVLLNIVLFDTVELEVIIGDGE